MELKLNLPIKPTQVSGPLFILLLASCGYLLEPLSTQWLGYDRILIEQQQYWRLLTGNLLHTNLNHLLLNGAGLILLWALHGEYYRSITYLTLFSFCAVICTGGLYLYATDMIWYVGLSGVLHGLLVWGACVDIQHKMKSGWVLLLAVWLKIGYEQIVGPNAEVAQLINANIATDAHLFGACGGLIWIAASLIYTRSRQSRSE